MIEIPVTMTTLSASREFRQYDHAGLSAGVSSSSWGVLTTIRVLSGLQIALGCASLITQGIFTGIILLHLQPEMRHFLLSFGVWAGLLFLATGVTGLRLRKSHFLHLPDLSQDSKHNRWRTALPTAYIVLNVLSALAAGALFALNIVHLLWLGQRPFFYTPQFILRHADIYLYQPLTGVLVALGVVQLVVSTIAASLTGSIRFRYGKYGSRSNNSSLRRIRSFIDYPSSTLGSQRGGGETGRRVRSYSQSSLVQPPVPLRNAPTSSNRNRAFYATSGGSGMIPVLPPPPSYEDAWEGIDLCRSMRQSRSRSASRERVPARGQENGRTPTAGSMTRSRSGAPLIARASF
ncbi:uncharacterized protein LOC129599642 [Paramacrobiotus metropolitanus]|uniref:uncharacterized protein LOC129599642 n=1 Tax=Paramacrobiotus metropolitanus TaxID=2943436 RepID=UPI0024456BFD|nr:uncharacterized protein LOC129599642 [Paramacrobiotus metropolitanus]